MKSFTPETYVSPDGKHRMRVTSPTVAVRMRARGWRPAPPARAAGKKTDKH